MTSAPPPAPPAGPAPADPPPWPSLPPQGEPAARPQLRRSRTDRVIGGVNGGLAEYSGIDPLLWRVGFVALAFAGGSGVLVYLLLWLLMPSGAPGTAPVPAGTGPVAQRPVPPRSPIPRITVAAGLILLGLLTLVDRLTAADLGPRAFFGTALLVVGLGLVAMAVSGARSSRGGLVALGVVLSLALIASAAAPWEHRGGVGDRTHSPTSEDSVPPVYRGGVGDLTIDLSRIDVGDLDQPIRFSVEHGVGDVEIVFPRAADVQLQVDSGLGDVEVFDEDQVDAGFFPGAGTGSWIDDEPEFDVRINSGVGDVEVSRA